jgi:hypothetical protein
MATNGKMDARQKIATLCAAMGLTHRITTAKGWSRLYVADGTGAERQIGRAWQREGEGWTLNDCAQQLHNEARAKVSDASERLLRLSTAENRVDNCAKRVDGEVARLAIMRNDLAAYMRQRDEAQAAYSDAVAALDDRERAILAALTEVQS